MKNKILFWLILSFTIVRLGVYVFINNHYFTRPFDFGFFSKLYSESQYVIGERSKGGIGDDGLYAFAGYYYFFQGGDVSAVNFEHPPLGKYLIGLSIFFFNNENVINIIYFVLILLITYKLSRLMGVDKVFSLLSIAILSKDPLFLDHLLRSQLDLPFTLFFLAAVYFFLKAFREKKQLFTSFFFWGCAFSTRFFPFFVLIFFYLLIITFFVNRQSLKTFFASAIVVPVLYLITHVSFFVYHPSIIEFLRHKKWMLSWFSGSVIIIGNIWRNILTGRYVDSAGRVTINEHWTIWQPMITVLSLVPQRFENEKSKTFLITSYGLCILFIVYVTFATNGVTKFIMPVYPLMIVLGIRQIEKGFYSIILICRKKILSRSKAK